MTRTTGSILGVGAIVAALLAAALVAIQSPPGSKLAPVSVVLSTDGNGACVQTVDEKAFDVVTIKNGQAVQYTPASGSNQFSITFPPSSLKNTGSPFLDPVSGYQYDIRGSGVAMPTAPSHITIFEYIGGIFSSNVLTFPYQSMTIDNKACTVRPGTGVHIDP